MPLYDYQCRACSKVTEVRHGFRDTHDEACPACGGTMARVFNAAGIVFKGSGFYVTDSRKSAEKAAEKSAEKSAETAAPKVSESAGSATTPAAPAPAAKSDAAPKKSESSAA